MNAWPEWLTMIPVLVLIAALLAAALSDALSYTIPNRCPLLVVAAFAAHSIGAAPAATLSSLLAAAAVFAVGLALFARGWLGGGDVKLIAAVALWAGPGELPDFLLVASLAGGGVALLYLSPLRRLLPLPCGAPADGPHGGPGDEDAAPAMRQPIPYGLAIAVGGLAIAAGFRP
jgi:prepilin peptidase CpaA